MQWANELSRSVPSHRQERRFDGGAWLTMVAGFGLMAINLVLVLWAFTVPTDGWWTQQGSGGWWAQQESGSPDASIRLLINQSGRPSPLQEDDRVLAINNQRPEEFVPGVGPLLEPGQPFDYRIQRNDEDMDVVALPVTRQPASILKVIAYNWNEGPLSVLAPIFFFLIGAFVFLMRPENTGGRYLFLVSSYYVCTLWTSADSYLMLSLYPPLLQWLIAWFGNSSWAWLFFPLLIQLVLVFPRRIGPMRRWPRLFPALLHGAPAIALLATSIPFFRSADPADLRINSDQSAAYFLVPMIAMFLFALVGSMTYNFRTVRDPVGRAQLRWFALGIGLGLGGMIAIYLAGGLLDEAGLLSEVMASVARGLMNSLLLLLPLGLGVAILRYRLFDIDVIIRKTLQYTVVTALLLLVYFGVVVALQQLFVRLTGQGSTAAVVLSTLAIAALFNPVRRRVQEAVDRRFFRQKYDAEQVLARFAATARDETDLDALTAELLRVIQETMQPASVSVWLKPTTDDRPQTTAGK